MRSTSRVHEPCRFEQLERREVLSAGNVTVRLESAEWRIRGDDNHNMVVMSELPSGSIRVQGGAIDGGKTTINGKPYVDITPSRQVSVALNGGNDRLELIGASARRLRFDAGLSISMGTGIDSVYSSYVTVAGPVSVAMGTGNGHAGYETATFVNSNLGGLSYTTDRSEGANSISLTVCTIRGNVSMRGSRSGFSVSIGASNITGSLSANLGGGQARLTITKSFAVSTTTIAGRIDLISGGARTQYSFSRVVADTIGVSCATDLDQIGVNDSRFRRARFDGGGGSNDRLWGRGNKFTERLEVRGIERNELRP